MFFGKRKTTFVIGGETIDYDRRDTLIVKARHGFGDNLMVTAVIRGVAREHCELRIIVLAKHPEIFAGNPDIFRCYNINDFPKRHPILKEAVDLEYRPLKTHKRPKYARVHLIDDLYDRLPLPIETRCYQPCIFLSDDEKNFRIDETGKLERPLVAICPYGKANSPIPSKIYPPDKWAAVVKFLCDRGASTLQFGMGSEGPVLPGAADWRDLGFRNMAGLLSRCDALITHPSGLMHLAAACQVPCVALYGGIESPLVSGYANNRNLTVSLDCAPCWKANLCRSPKCLDLMTPEQIAAQTLDLIADNAG